MAITTVTTRMAAGINYTVVTDSSADWTNPTLLPNTYFYDKTDKLVHYKDSTGTIQEIFSSTATASGLKHGVATGTNTYAVTITGVTSYTDGDAYAIRFTNGNDADSTIDINGLGVKTLVKEANIQVTGGDIVSGQELIIIYDGTNFQCVNVAPNQMFAFVTNDDSVTITKGQPVYAFGAAGNRMSVKLAANTADATSAQTVGVVFSSSIAANQRGFIITQGIIGGLDTSMYNPGDQLYLGDTAGSLTSIKPFAPNHLVYIGIVERANAGNGQIYVKPQNGYELDELHDVNLITTPPQNGDVLTYDAVNDLWIPAAIPGVSNVGNQLLSGGASWSGTGMVFNVSKLSYLIDTTPYTSAPQNVTLAVGDLINPRFDAIVVDASGVVSVIQGTPAANPIVPPIPGTQVLVQYVLVGAGQVTPSITNEFVYREGSSPDWNTSSVAGTAPSLSVDFSSTVLPPFLGTQSTLVTAPSFVNTNPPTKYIQYAKPVGNISRSAFPFFSFRVRLPASLPARNIQVVLYNNTTIIGSVLATNWGMNMTSINNWQLVSIPISAFGNLGITTITSVRFFMTGVAANTFAAGFDRYGLDDIKFQSGYGPQTNTATIEVLDTGVTVGSTAKLNFINGNYLAATATNDMPNNRVDVKFDITGIPLSQVLAAGNTTLGQSITLTNANDFINVLSGFSYIGGTGIPSNVSGIKFGGDGNGITLQQYNDGIGDPNYGAVSLNVNNKTLVIRAVLGSTFAGAQYFADYSANYTARSLTDKGYVDSVAIPFIPLPDAYEVFRGRTYRYNSTAYDTYANVGTLNNFAAAATVTGTTSFYQRFVRLKHYRTTVSSGIMTSVAGTDLQWTLSGGFRFVVNFRVSDTAYSATCQQFYGLAGTTAELAYGGISNIQLDTLTNLIGIGNNGTDTNLHIYHNDSSGTCTKVNLGAGFPANRTAGSEMTTMYSVQLYNEVGTTTVKYEVINLETGAIARGTVSTDLPAITQGLTIHSTRANGTGGGTTNAGQYELHKWGCYDIIK